MKTQEARPSGPLRKYGLLLLAVLGGAAAAVSNLDTLASTWNKYFSHPSGLEALEMPVNQPVLALNADSPVQLELVQTPEDQDSSEQIYDVYLHNTGSEDVLLTEVFYAKGYLYASASAGVNGSQQLAPNSSYQIPVKSTLGQKAALSPPYLLKGASRGGIRLRFTPDADRGSSGATTLAFEVLDSKGNKIAAVNRMLRR